MVLLLNLGLIASHLMGAAFPLERWLTLDQTGVHLTSLLTEITLCGAGKHRDPTWMIFGLSAAGLVLFLVMGALALFAGTYAMRRQVEEALVHHPKSFFN